MKKSFLKSTFHVSSFKFHDKRGQTIVEAIIALGALVISFSGIFALLSTSLHNHKIVTNNSLATYLAAEGIEVVKNILDRNAIAGSPWSTGFSSGDYEVDYASDAMVPYADRNLFFNAGTNLYSYGGAGDATAFKRRIRITFFGAEEMEVNSIVSWTTGQSQSSVNLEDHFLDWRP